MEQAPIAAGPIEATVRPLPCPFCGKPMHDNGEMGKDTLYPSGVGWRFNEELQMRTYHRAQEVPKEQRCFSLHCATSYGGCGAEMHGDSQDEAITKWNYRADQRERFAMEVESFAQEYVKRWGGNKDAKNAGWAILQASSHLRSNAGNNEPPKAVSVD